MSTAIAVVSLVSISIIPDKNPFAMALAVLERPLVSIPIIPFIETLPVPLTFFVEISRVTPISKIDYFIPR